MRAEADPDRGPIRVVLGDANVLYSRVLRDYLLYSTARQLISIRWSPKILAEVVEHLIANIAEFDAAAGARLIAAMNSTFPFAEVTPTDEAYQRIHGRVLPDEGDRHVIATAIAAEADVLCTDNIVDFPPAIMDDVGIQGMTADDLLALLVVESGDDMREVHQTVVARFPQATDATTLAALRRAGAVKTAELVAGLLIV